MIIPKPKQYEEVGELTVACAISADGELAFCKKAFKRMVKKAYGVSLVDGDEGLSVAYDASLEEEEYKIDGATVYASTLFGAKNGLASVLQLIKKADKEGIVLTETKVQDRPDKDFRAFMAAGSKITDTVREIKYFKAERIGDDIIFTVAADGFLYNMVRIFVGTMLAVAEGKVAPDAVPGIIDSRDRKNAGITVPAHGLYLNRVVFR